MYKNSANYEIYTPSFIAKYMAKLIGNINSILDPAIGIGKLLKYIKNIPIENITGYDIKDKCIEICKNKYINIYQKDFLFEENIFAENIIMNPPYIRIQDLEEEYREKLKIFNLTGNLDIYMAFIVKCCKILTSGKIVAIIPNSWIYTNSGERLRKFFINYKFLEKLIDFGESQIFKNITVYCCIIVLNKNNKNTFKYKTAKVENKKIIKSKSKIIDYNNLTEINFLDTISNNITNINSELLGNIIIIKNGIATLADKLYIFDNPLNNEECWKPIFNPSKKIKYIIYPYINGILFEEEFFKKTYPLTYNYLLLNKDKLLLRDSGKIPVNKWYAYGRHQSIHNHEFLNKENIIYIPNILSIKEPNIKIEKPMLFKNCLAICSNKPEISISNIYSSIIKELPYLENISQKKKGGFISINTTNVKKLKYLPN